jgi:hypothetical protein
MDDPAKHWNDASLNSFFRWLKIREENGIKLTNVKNLLADSHHSSLLRRLLAGKEPLEVVPPKKYAYPWYELMETGSAEETDIQVMSHQKLVAICQFAWAIISTIEVDRQYLIRPFTHRPEDPVWELTRTDKKTSWNGELWGIKRYNGDYGLQNLSSSQPQCSVLQEEVSQ